MTFPTRFVETQFSALQFLSWCLSYEKRSVYRVVEECELVGEDFHEKLVGDNGFSLLFCNSSLKPVETTVIKLIKI